MRRLTSSIGIALLTLMLSGWGNALAAAMCPHARMNQTQAMGQEHSHCPAKAEMAEAHHSASHQPQAMNDMEMPPAPQQQDDVAVILGLPTGTCTHCIGQSDSPATLASARELTLKKRDAGTEIEQPLRLVASVATAFTPQFIPTQNAPPGPANRRHLLLGVFLI